PAAAAFDQLAQADQVRVPQILHRAEFVLEAQQRVGAHGMQHLERDARALLAIERLVHLAGAARTEPTDELESRRPPKRRSDARPVQQPSMLPLARAR